MKKCRGILIPQYRLERHISRQLVPLTEKIGKIKPKGDDDFDITVCYREIEPICADCRQTICRGMYGVAKREEENEP